MKKIPSLALALSLLSVGGVALSVPLVAQKNHVAQAEVTLTQGANGFYQIGSVEDLAKVASDILGGTGADYKYELTADIDLSGGLWTPIGTTTNPFTGIFNGNGYTISGAVMLDPSVIDNFGIFGSVNGAQIVDLVIDNSFQYTADATKVCGTLAGSVVDSTIAAVYDQSMISGVETIGQISGSSKLYRGGHGLTVGQAVDESITVSGAIPSSVVEGTVVTFDVADGAFYTKDATPKQISSSTYKVLMENSNPVALVLDGGVSLNSFGTVYPNTESSVLEAKKAGYGLDKTSPWLAGGTAVSTFTDTAIADNNYVINANWVEIKYTLQFYKGATELTVLSDVSMGSSWEEDVLKKIATIVDNHDLIKITDASNNVYYEVEITYDESGNKQIAGTKVIELSNPAYNTAGLTSETVDFGAESKTVSLYTEWKSHNVNPTMTYATTTGADFSKITESLKDSSNNDIELGTLTDNSRQITVLPGAELTYTITVPAGYCAPVVSVDGEELTPSVSGSTYTYDINSNSFTNTTSININIERQAYDIALTCENASITLTDNTSYTTLSGNTITTYVDETFGLSVTANDGYEISAINTPGLSSSVSIASNKLTATVSGCALADLAGSRQINIGIAEQLYTINFSYSIVSDYADLTGISKPETTITVGSKTFTRNSNDPAISSVPLAGGQGAISVAGNEYYTVTGVSFNGSTLTESAGSFTFSDSSLATGGTYNLVVTLAKKEYTITTAIRGDYLGSSENFAWPVDKDGNSITTAEGLANLATVTAPTTFNYGDKINLSLNIISKFYEFGGWYYNNGDQVFATNNTSVSGEFTPGLGNYTIYATLKEKSYTFNFSTSAIIVDKDGVSGATADWAEEDADYLTYESTNSVVFTFGSGSTCYGPTYSTSSIGANAYTFDGWYVGSDKLGEDRVISNWTDLYADDGILATDTDGIINVVPGVKQKSKTFSFTAQSYVDLSLVGSFENGEDSYSFTYYYGQEDEITVNELITDSGLTPPTGHYISSLHFDGWYYDRYYRLQPQEENGDLGLDDSMNSDFNYAIVDNGFVRLSFAYQANTYTLSFYDVDENGNKTDSLIGQRPVTYGNYFYAGLSRGGTFYRIGDNSYYVYDQTFGFKGYDFSEWKDVDSGTIYAKDEEFTYNVARDMTLVPADKTKKTYTFIINKNNEKDINSSSERPTEEKTVTYGDDILSLLSDYESQMTREGYKFAGWAIDANGVFKDNSGYYYADESFDNQVIIGHSDHIQTLSDGIYFNGNKLYGQILADENGKILFNVDNFVFERYFRVDFINENGERFVGKAKASQFVEVDTLLKYYLGVEDNGGNGTPLLMIYNNGFHLKDGESIEFTSYSHSSIKTTVTGSEQNIFISNRMDKEDYDEGNIYYSASIEEDPIFGYHSSDSYIVTPMISALWVRDLEGVQAVIEGNVGTNGTIAVVNGENGYAEELYIRLNDFDGQQISTDGYLLVNGTKYEQNDYGDGAYSPNYSFNVYWQKKQADGTWVDCYDKGGNSRLTFYTKEDAGTYRAKFILNDNTKVCEELEQSVVYSNEIEIYLINPTLRISNEYSVTEGDEDGWAASRRFDKVRNYKTLRFMMDETAEFFRAHPEFDEEGVFTDYTTDTTLSEILQKFADKEILIEDSFALRFDYRDGKIVYREAKVNTSTNDIKDLDNNAPEYKIIEYLNEKVSRAYIALNADALNSALNGMGNAYSTMPKEFAGMMSGGFEDNDINIVNGDYLDVIFQIAAQNLGLENPPAQGSAEEQELKTEFISLINWFVEGTELQNYDWSNNISFNYDDEGLMDGTFTGKPTLEQMIALKENELYLIDFRYGTYMFEEMLKASSLTMWVQLCEEAYPERFEMVEVTDPETQETTTQRQVTEEGRLAIIEEFKEMTAETSLVKGWDENGRVVEDGYAGQVYTWDDITFDLTNQENMIVGGPNFALLTRADLDSITQKFMESYFMIAMEMELGIEFITDGSMTDRLSDFASFEKFIIFKHGENSLADIYIDIGKDSYKYVGEGRGNLKKYYSSVYGPTTRYDMASYNVTFTEVGLGQGHYVKLPEYVKIYDDASHFYYPHYYINGDGEWDSYEISDSISSLFEIGTRYNMVSEGVYEESETGNYIKLDRDIYYYAYDNDGVKRGNYEIETIEYVGYGNGEYALQFAWIKSGCGDYSSDSQSSNYRLYGKVHEDGTTTWKFGEDYSAYESGNDVIFTRDITTDAEGIIISAEFVVIDKETNAELLRIEIDDYTFRIGEYSSIEGHGDNRDEGGLMAEFYLGVYGNIEYELRNLSRKTFLEGIYFEDIIVADGLERYYEAGTEYVNFINGISFNDAQIGLYSESYWKIAFDESYFTQELADKGYASYKEYALDNVNVKELIKVKNGGNVDYYIINPEGWMGNESYYMGGVFTGAGTPMSKGAAKIVYTELSDNTIFEGVHDTQLEDGTTVVEVEKTVTGIIDGDVDSSVTFTLQTTSNVAGAYSMFDDTLKVIKAKINDGKGNVYTVVRSGYGTFKFEEGSEIDGIDPNKYTFWIENELIVRDITDDDFVQELDVHKVKAGADYNSLLNADLTNERISVSAITANINGEEVVVDVTGKNGAIYTTVDGTRYFLGEIIGNGTLAVQLNFTSYVTKYTYTLEDIGNTYFLGDFATSTADSDYIAAIKAYDFANAVSTTQTVEVATETSDKFLVISTAQLVEIKDGYTSPENQVQEIYVNLNEDVVLENVVTITRENYAILNYTANTSNITIADGVLKLTSYGAANITLTWKPTALVVISGTNSVTATATEGAVSYTASDFITEVKDFASTEYTCAWKVGSDPNAYPASIDLHKESHSGTYTILVKHNTYLEATAEYDVTFTISQAVVDIKSVTGLSDLVYSNSNKLDNEISFTFTNDMVKDYSGDDFVSFSAYSDANCTTAVTQIVNAGTYYIKVVLNTDVYGYNTGSTYYNSTVGAYVYEVTVDKLTHELTQAEAGLTKIFGESDPTLTRSINLVNEQVDITFTREEGKEVGEYKLSIASVKVGDNPATNYTITIPDNKWFVIQSISEGILIKLDETFTKIYDGNIISHGEIENPFVLKWNEDKEKYIFYLTVGEASVPVSLYYKEGNNGIAEITATGGMLAGLKINLIEDAKDTGEYKIEISGKAVGHDGYSQFITIDSDNKIESVDDKTTLTITPKEISISSASKEFDNTKDFDSTVDTATFTGVVDGDEVNFTATYASVGTAEDIATPTAIAIENITLTGSQAGNYVLAAGSYTGIVTKNTTWAQNIEISVNKEFTYGEITSANYASVIGAEISIMSGDIDVASFVNAELTITNSTYSTGTYLKQGSYEVSVVLTSGYLDNLTAESFTLVVNQLKVALVISKTVKSYDGTPNLAPSANVTVNTLEGDEVECNVVYAQANRGENIEFVITASGADADNYNITTTQTGSIVDKLYTLNLDNTKYTFVDDGESVISDLTTTFNYVEGMTKEEAFAKLPTPTRKGYTFEGWYKEESLSTKLTEENILKFFADNATAESVTIYSNWTINTYTLKVVVADNSGNEDSARGTYSVTPGTGVEGVYTFDYFTTIKVTATANANYVFTEARLAKVAETAYTNIADVNGTINDIQKISENYVLTLRFRDVNVSIKTISEGTENVVEYSFGSESIATSKAYSVLSPASQKTGYSINKWYYENPARVNIGETETLKDVINAIVGESAIADGQEFTFYAEWKANTYGVIFNDQNGNTWPAVAIYDKALEEAEGYVDPVRRGYKFIEWNTATDGNGTSYLPETIYNVTDSITLYAIWVKSEFTLDVTLECQYETSYTFEVYVDNTWTAIEKADTYTITAETQYRFAVDPRAGYVVAFEYDATHLAAVKSAENENVLLISTIKANTELEIKITPVEHTITLITENGIPAEVTVSGTPVTTTSTANGHTFMAATDTQVAITMSPKAGYEINYGNYELGEGEKATLVSGVTRLLVHSFTADLTIKLTATPKSYTASFTKGTGVENVSIVEGGTIVTNGIRVTTDTALKVKLTTGYGYVKPVITNISDANIVASEVDAENNIWEITGFTTEFSFTAEAEPTDFAVRISTLSLDTNDVLTTDENSAMLLQNGSSLVGSKAKYLSVVNYVASVQTAGYVFYGWFTGVESAEGKITNYGTLVSEELAYDHTVLADISLTAIFKFTEVTIRAQADGNGSLAYEIIGKNESQKDFTTNNLKVPYGSVVKYTATPSKGYNFEGWVDQDGNAFVSGEDVVIENNTIAIAVKADMELYAKFVAGSGAIDAEAKLYINGINVDHKNTDFAKIIDGSYDQATQTFTANTGNKEVAKSITFTTDVDTYIQIEVYQGYTFEGLQSVLVDDEVAAVTNKVYEYQQGTTKYYIYQITNLKAGENYATLEAKISAAASPITINFVNEKGTIVDAGRILIDETSFGVLVSGNYTSNVKVDAITGSKILVTAYARFDFDIAESNYHNIVGSVNIEEINAKEEDPSTGFTSSLSFEISEFSAASTISVRVVSSQYNVEIYNGAEKIGSTITGVQVGDILTLGSIYEEIKMLVVSRKGYELTGFYTAENANGTKYIDGSGNVLKEWSEKGYTWTGTEYVSSANYNEETRTFKLYAGWERLKSAIKIKTTPIGIQGVDPTVAATVVISSINNTNSWLDENDNYYVDMLYGADLKLKAPIYENYKFAAWIITLDGEVQEPITTEVYVKEGGFANKDVIINAIYLPRVALTSTNGGSATLTQGEVVITNGQEGYLSAVNNFELVAVSKKGYAFEGWYNKETGELISDATTYVFGADEENEFVPMAIEAVFVGNIVDIVIGDYDNKFGKVEKVVYNNNAQTETFQASVGDSIEIYVSLATHETKLYGVSWNLGKIDYARSEDDYMVYRYVINGEDVNDNSEIIITPIFTEKTITINFNITLFGDPNYSKAGSVSAQGLVNNTLELSYGIPLNVAVNVARNYKIAKMELSGRTVLEFYENGVLTIPSYLISNSFEEKAQFVVTIEFKEDLWIESKEMSSSLEGEGTQNLPFRIKSAGDLALIAYRINIMKDEYYASAHYVLVNDIDLVGKFWTPIGTEENPFSGSFSFAGYKPFGITLTPGYNEETTKYFKVFGVVSDNARFVENNNAILIIAISVSAAVVVAAVALTVILVLRKKKKKKISELANS